jgi:hypothetical protein
MHEWPGLQSVLNTQAKAGVEMRKRTVIAIKLRIVVSRWNPHRTWFSPLFARGGRMMSERRYRAEGEPCRTFSEWANVLSKKRA